MSKRTLWLLLIGLVVVGLILSSCGPAATTPPTTPPTTTPPTTTPPTSPPPTTPAAGQPKYGGSITISWNTDPLDFDQGYKSAWYAFTLDATNDTLSIPDWKKGPLGTNEIPFRRMDDIPSDLRTGISTWSTPDPNTIIFKIRQGIHFQNKPPVNGREMVADDVVASIQRMFTLPGSWLYAFPIKPTSVTATDKYTITLKFPSFDPSLLHNRISETLYIVPRELVLDASGKETGLMRDWRNSNGTGAFKLTNYVPGASIDFVKNPDYWEVDPFRPQNKLPYVDTLKVLIIPDLSTRLSALRAGKLDTMSGITRQDADSLKKTNPQINNGTHTTGSVMGAWPNVQVSPMNDLKVRTALSVAIDRSQLIKDLYGGQADLLFFWVPPTAIKAFTPFDQLPAETKALYTYNPDKAKQLLKDAGYPNGFKTQIVIDAADPTLQDLSAQIKGYWEKIGVQTSIDAQAYAVYNSIRYSNKYNGFILGGWMNAAAIWNNFDIFRTGHYSNWATVSDPYWDAQSLKIAGTLDENTRYQMCKEINIYALNQVWNIITPSPYYNVFWQPWMKGYEGVYYMGIYHYFKPFSYAWIDKS